MIYFSIVHRYHQLARRQLTADVAALIQLASAAHSIHIDRDDVVDLGLACCDHRYGLIIPVNGVVDAKRQIYALGGIADQHFSSVVQHPSPAQCGSSPGLVDGGQGKTMTVTVPVGSWPSVNPQVQGVIFSTIDQFWGRMSLIWSYEFATIHIDVCGSGAQEQIQEAAAVLYIKGPTTHKIIARYLHTRIIQPINQQRKVQTRHVDTGYIVALCAIYATELIGWHTLPVL